MSMTKEFDRWIEAGRPSVWYKTKHTDEMWMEVYIPAWEPENDYIIDDKHATLRRLQVGEPETKFEVELSDGWTDVREPLWNLDNEYRVKVESETDTYYEVIDPIAKVILLIPSFGGIDISYIKTGRSFELPTKDL